MRHDHSQHRARARTLYRLRLFGGIGALLLAGIGSTVAAERSGTTKLSKPHFGVCAGGKRVNCVIDGDTFWIAGEKIRIADIDTPETHPARCAAEAALGAKATLRLQALLNRGPVTMAIGARDTDRYGRKLRIVSLRGVSVGDMLVSEGLAREWTGRRMPWCA